MVEVTTDLRERLERTLGDAYSIERELGGGGMSRVFVALERSLGRQVVVKVLPEEMAGQVSVDRFRREISLAAQLQHPHIVPLLTAGDSDGLPYFTMPYVKGESLRARIAHGGELPVSEAMRVLREVASALAFAHDAGVVHRDIKPDNVLLSGGSAMVTDFGVAKAVSAATTQGRSGLTSLGVALGTPAYMSPEQASADPMVDHRADIYSWGILAYELLTGGTPYTGRPASAMLAAHVTEAAEPVARRRPGVPVPLAALVMKCLEKRPSDRPQSAAEIVRALDDMVTPSGGSSPTRATTSRVGRGGAIAGAVAAAVLVALGGYWSLHRTTSADGTGVHTVAVLPFDNRSGDSTYDYLADGMSDELRSALTGVEGVSVKARSSSAQLRGKGAREAGAKLDVAAVLEGSISRAGQRLRVTAELVRVAGENTLWSGSFDREAKDLPAVQDSIIRAIRGVLKVRDGAAITASGAAGARGTADVEAYDLFLRGEFLRRRFDIPGAVPLLKGAVAKDPSFARAHASLASAYAILPFVGIVLPASAHADASASVERALSLAPQLTAAHVAQAQLLLSEFRYPDAERVLQKAVAADSGDAEARVWHAFLLGCLGRIDEALAEVRTAIRLDPLSTDALITESAIQMYRHRYAESIAGSKAVIALDPKSSIAFGNLGEAYALMGQLDSAVTAVEAALRIDATAYGVRSQVLFVYAIAGRWKEADEQARLALADGQNSPHFMKAATSIVHGDIDAAMKATELGVRAREPFFNSIWLSCDPMFEILHARAAFVALMRELGATMCPANSRWPIAPRK